MLLGLFSIYFHMSNKCDRQNEVAESSITYTNETQMFKTVC